MSIKAASDLLTWLVSVNGYVHPSLALSIDDEYGLAVKSTAPIETDERLVSCPFKVAITPSLAALAVTSVLGKDEAALVWQSKTGNVDTDADVEAGSSQSAWTDRMKIAAYIILHWIHMDSAEWPKPLAHRVYIASLPPYSSFRTPLHFTSSELALLEGTNLHGAVLDREAEWKREAEAVAVLLGPEATWERYLTAATCISSRAFPSRLLSLDSEPSSGVRSDTESSPVLLPGVDLFNHSRAQPILWLSSLIPSPSSSSTTAPAISLVSASSIPSSVQVFNNYGPKPNDELLLGYGFVLTSNPSDVLYLRLGASGMPGSVVERVEKKGLDVGERFEVGRDGKVPSRLLEVMRAVLGDDRDEEHEGHEHEEDEDEDEDEHDHGKEEEEMNLELDVLDMLGQMLNDKLKRIDAVREVEAEVRTDVRAMCEEYRQGQRAILQSALSGVKDRVQRVENLLEEGMGCACCF